MVPSACCILDQTKYPWTISPEDSHCVFVPTKYNSYWMQVDNTLTHYNIHIHNPSFPGLSSKTLPVFNQPHFFCDPCTYLPPNPGDDSSDPSSVSVLATEDKNRQDCSYSYCQGTHTAEK